MVDKAQLHKLIDELSPQSLEKVEELVEQLNAKDSGSAWAKDLYDLFAPVRAEVEAKGMTEEEVNQIIDDAIEEVRRERKP